MTHKKQYDVLELNKMNLAALCEIASALGIDTNGKLKQWLIYEILDVQFLNSFK